MPLTLPVVLMVMLETPLNDGIKIAVGLLLEPKATPLKTSFWSVEDSINAVIAVDVELTNLPAAVAVVSPPVTSE